MKVRKVWAGNVNDFIEAKVHSTEYKVIHLTENFIVIFELVE